MMDTKEIYRLELETTCVNYIQYINNALTKVISRYNFLCPKLSSAINYSLFSGGKRVRPLLVLGAAKCLGIKLSDILIAACAVEFMHTYSLIHDDLPDMDNDSMRRGKKACHIVYGATTAILAGDALQCLAFEVITNTKLFPESSLDEISRFELVKLLSQAAGASGMVGGQSLDCEATSDTINIKHIETIHANKTSALIQASIKMGLVSNNIPCTKKTSHIKSKLAKFSEKYGALFQVCDDIKDFNVEDKNSCTEKQQANNTDANIVNLVNITEAKKHAHELQQQTLAELEGLGVESHLFSLLTEGIFPK